MEFILTEVQQDFFAELLGKSMVTGAIASALDSVLNVPVLGLWCQGLNNSCGSG